MKQSLLLILSTGMLLSALTGCSSDSGEQAASNSGNSNSASTVSSGETGEKGERTEGDSGESGERGERTEGDSGERGERTEGDSGERGERTEGDSGESGERGERTEGESGERGERTEGDSGEKGERTEGGSGETTTTSSNTRYQEDYTVTIENRVVIFDGMPEELIKGQEITITHKGGLFKNTEVYSGVIQGTQVEIPDDVEIITGDEYEVDFGIEGYRSSHKHVFPT